MVFFSVFYYFDCRFSTWPENALRNVSEHFLGTDFQFDLDVFSRIHASVIDVSELMSKSLLRLNHITPTHFIELVKGFKHIYNENSSNYANNLSKMENGLVKLDEASKQVSELTVLLESKKKIVALKKHESEKMLIEIVQQQRFADEQKKLVEFEAVKIENEEKECNLFVQDIQRELEVAEPELNAAQDALNDLKKEALTEIRSYAKPPPLVEKVLCAVMIALNLEPSWSQAKKELTDPNFILQLRSFRPQDMNTSTLKTLTKRVSEAEFDPETVRTKSTAAAVLCTWCIAVQKYVTVFRLIEPKRAALVTAQESLENKRLQLISAREKLKIVIENVAALQERYDKSENEKNSFRKEAVELETKLKRASDLVTGLHVERTRWEATISLFLEKRKNVIGDCLMAASFLAYAGPFNTEFRFDLMKSWKSIISIVASVSSDFSNVSFLSTTSKLISWQLCGLPSDALSSENGVLVTSAHKWYFDSLLFYNI